MLVLVMGWWWFEWLEGRSVLVIIRTQPWAQGSQQKSTRKNFASTARGEDKTMGVRAGLRARPAYEIPGYIMYLADEDLTSGGTGHILQSESDIIDLEYMTWNLAH